MNVHTQHVTFFSWLVECVVSGMNFILVLCACARVCAGGQPEPRWVRGEIRDGCDEWKLGLFWFLCERW